MHVCFFGKSVLVFFCYKLLQGGRGVPAAAAIADFVGGLI